MEEVPDCPFRLQSKRAEITAGFWQEAAAAGPFLARVGRVAYSSDMENPKESGPDQAQGIDTGEVPEKQLLRWKDEGGALPPEPDSDTGSDDDPGSGAGPEADDV